MLVDPGLGRMQRVLLNLAGTHAAIFFGTDKPAFLEYADVLEQRWQGQAKRLSKFADRFGAITQTTDDRPSCRIGECGKCSVQIG